MTSGVCVIIFAASFLVRFAFSQRVTTTTNNGFNDKIGENASILTFSFVVSRKIMRTEIQS
jgi:hypothetical protein